MTRSPSEFEIQRALCGWLDGWPDSRQPKQPALLPDVIYWHTPNGGARNAIEGKRFKESGVKAGIFDLTFIHCGRVFVLELKDNAGRLSNSQIEMWKRYQLANVAGIAVAHSLEVAKKQLFEWGLTFY